MRVIKLGGRAAVASISLCLSIFMLTITAAPSLATFVVPVTPGDGGGPLGPCQGCDVQLSGTATGGNAENTQNGSQFDLNYAVPGDGTMYSGTIMTQVVNADGTVTVNTFAISDFGNPNSTGGFATAWNNSSIPLGGSASITINESNGNGKSFVAGYTVRNFRP